jgi:hypothetical protein
VHSDLDAEAIRVISMLSDFESAMQRGKPVRMSFNIHMKAKINRDKPSRQHAGPKF